MSETPRSISPALTVDAPKSLVDHLAEARGDLNVAWLALSTVRYMLDPEGIPVADGVVPDPHTVAQLASDIAARSRALVELACTCRGLLGEFYPDAVPQSSEWPDAAVV